MPLAKSVYNTSGNEINGVPITCRHTDTVTRPVDASGSGPSFRQRWFFSTVFSTLPPLTSVMPEPISDDPATAMLAAIKAAGGCLEIPEAGHNGRWVVLCPHGAALRFPSPVGHRLVSNGLICRHPSDRPGEERHFVRFIPRENLPAGFEFKVSNVDTARHYDSKIKSFTEEEYLAHIRAGQYRRNLNRNYLAGGTV